jgi:O-antigen/teichoic acid export membrane protein
MSLARDTTTSAIATLALTSSRLVVNVLLARRLTPGPFGELVFAQFVIDLIFMVVSVGIPGTLTRFLPAMSDLAPSVTAKVYRRLFVLAALSLVAAEIVFAGYLEFEQPGTSLRTASLLLLCFATILASLVSAALQGLFRYDAIMYGNIAFAVAAPLFTVIFVRQPAVENAAFALATAWLLNVAVAAATGRRKLRGSDASLRPGSIPRYAYMAAYGVRVWLTALISGLVWSRGELAILKQRVTTADIGIYSIALTLAGAVTQGSAMLTGALSSHLTRHWHNADVRRIEGILRTATQGVLVVTICGSLLLMCAGQALIPIILGPKYAQSYEILAVLSISSISIACGSANSVLQLETNAKFALSANIVGLIILVGLSIALAPRLSITGAAVARTCAQTVVALWTFHRLREMDGLGKVGRDLTVAFSLCILGLGACYVLIHTIAANLVARLTCGLLFSAALCGIIRALIGIPYATYLPGQNARSASTRG